MALVMKDSRYRITHQQWTKQQEEQHNQDYWTWEEILDGDGPWTQPGEYRHPKAELEAAKGERWRYEEAARQHGWKPERQTQKCIGGRHTGSVVKPAPRICRARVRIQPGQMVPALLSRQPVGLLGPGYPAPALRSVSPVCLHSPVRPVPAPRTGRARVTIQPGRVVQAISLRPPPTPRTRPPVRLHSPVYPVPPVPTPRTRPPVCLHSPVHPVPPPRTRPEVRVSSPVPPVQHHVPGLLCASRVQYTLFLLPTLAMRCVSSTQYHQCGTTYQAYCAPPGSSTPCPPPRTRHEVRVSSPVPPVRHHVPGHQCASRVQYSLSSSPHSP
ncbi:uncharacterized protein LOC135511508 [Oncorhynchus masou masou]|uniref:uncharacterized protein LOC135511508 n=1 Tax=Oncorhynchus masou masou TaxID=90313 RepID=UPI0031839FB9